LHPSLLNACPYSRFGNGASKALIARGVNMGKKKISLEQKLAAGGRKGIKAMRAKLTADQRRQQARKAAVARWAKNKK
jgi:hypothetical protein